jgi:hypothetical protein
VTHLRRYRYVGPAEVRDRAVLADVLAVDSPVALAARLAGRERGELAEPCTFVVALDGALRSTGYCPDPDSWPAVSRALDRVGACHPGDFTYKVIFRRCPACGERNVVRDNDFTCALCDSALPPQWNFPSINVNG